MKRYLTATSLAVALASGLTFGFGIEKAEATSNNNEIIAAATSTWTLYYTDYAYNDGWYAKWYRNHTTGQKKKETYMANGKLYSVDYY
ncbi:hypothetical protein ACFTQ7_22735 [Lysinibacillus sp. NPDC056959]|uniref:hypothetical protein n=1 Tax=Lysinibacillus sp. NPDC056959 TaxID=3345981 RepID=UPI0036394AEF